MRNKLYLNASFKQMDEDDESLLIEGFASTSDKDRYGDVILPKAWEKSLDIYMKNPILLAYHRMDMPIGKVLEAKVPFL